MTNLEIMADKYTIFFFFNDPLHFQSSDSSITDVFSLSRVHLASNTCSYKKTKRHFETQISRGRGEVKGPSSDQFITL